MRPETKGGVSDSPGRGKATIKGKNSIDHQQLTRLPQLRTNELTSYPRATCIAKMLRPTFLLITPAAIPNRRIVAVDVSLWPPGTHSRAAFFAVDPRRTCAQNDGRAPGLFRAEPRGRLVG